MNSKIAHLTSQTMKEKRAAAWRDPSKSGDKHPNARSIKLRDATGQSVTIKNVRWYVRTHRAAFISRGTVSNASDKAIANRLMRLFHGLEASVYGWKAL